MQSRKLVHLTPLDLSNIPAELHGYIAETGSEVTLDCLERFTSTFLGSRAIADEIAIGIADGNIDPETKVGFNNYSSYSAFPTVLL